MDVDLVINFKCNLERSFRKNVESEALSSCQEYLTMATPGSSAGDMAGAWKEKFRIYAEQVNTYSQFCYIGNFTCLMLIFRSHEMS